MYISFLEAMYSERKQRKTWTLYFWVSASACAWSRCIECERAEHKTATSKINVCVLREPMTLQLQLQRLIFHLNWPHAISGDDAFTSLPPLGGGPSEKAEAQLKKKNNKNQQSELHFSVHCKSRRSQRRAARSHASSAMGQFDFSCRPVRRHHPPLWD